MSGWDAVVAYIAAGALVQLARITSAYRTAKRRDEARAGKQAS
jgi:hypothetical protein